MFNQIANLSATGFAIKRFGSALHRITHAVCFRAPTPMPKRMEWQPPAIAGLRQQGFRQYRESATYPCKPAGFGKTAKLYRAFVRARYFKDRMRQLWIADIGLISR